MPPDRRPAGTDFHILCGFLGSGKTTLLVDYLATPEATDTAVLVNDVGQVDVDGAVVTASSTGTPIAMLANGCVCCSIGSELATTIQGLVLDRQARDRPPFRRMILECSGLSRPGPILRSLADLGRFDFRVRILATFDAGQGRDHAAHFEEAAAQLAAAQTVVLTKLDLLEAAAGEGAAPADQAAAAARALNPLATVLAEPDRRARALAAFSTAGPGAAPRPEPLVVGLGTLRHPRIGVFLAEVPPAPDWDRIAIWIEDLAALCGDRLLRVKGLVQVDGVDGPVLIQGVGTIFSPPLRVPAGTGEPGSVVIIAHDMDQAELAAASAAHGVSLRAG